MHYTYKIFPLGDSALTIDFGNRIDEKINQEVIARFHHLKNEPIEGVLDIVPAYSSISVFYDTWHLQKKIHPGGLVYDWMKDQVDVLIKQSLNDYEIKEMLVHIPVCYDLDYAPDLQKLSKEKNMSPEELISIHTAGTYKIYMLGFLPGFAYMGEVDERIAAKRKDQPVNMVAGSVGIAGRQTGIYPLDSPGGWQIIGRTPWKLFDPERPEPVLLNAGEKVQFYSIGKEEFNEMQKTDSYT